MIKLLLVILLLAPFGVRAEEQGEEDLEKLYNETVVDMNDIIDDAVSSWLDKHLPEGLAEDAKITRKKFYRNSTASSVQIFDVVSYFLVLSSDGRRHICNNVSQVKITENPHYSDVVDVTGMAKSISSEEIHCKRLPKVKKVQIKKT